MTDRRPVAIDLFAGAGGMSLGLEQAGFDVVAAVEWDAVHAAAHRFNFPRCAVLSEDVSTISPEALRAAARTGAALYGRALPRQIDLIAGGPPCQGFSVGGLKDPGDPRNLLIAEFVRLVVALRPRAVLLENVPAMASRLHAGSDVRVADWLCDQLTRAGYAVCGPTVVNASWYGVPQDRRRLFVAGVLAGSPVPAPVPDVVWRARRVGGSARPGPAGWRPTTDLPAGPTVADALADVPDLDEFEALLSSDSVQLDSALSVELAATASPYGDVLAGRIIADRDLSHPRVWSCSKLTSSLRTAHAPAIAARFAQVAPGERDAISRFERLDGEGLCPTLRAGSTPDRGSYSAPRPIHPDHNRVISVREAARLHGFPDWFRFTAAKWHGFRQVGNAVCPPVAMRFGEAVIAALDADPGPRPREPLALGEHSLLRVAGARGQRSRARSLLAA